MRRSILIRRWQIFCSMAAAASLLCSGCGQTGSNVQGQEAVTGESTIQPASAEASQQVDASEFEMKLRNKQGMEDKEGVYYEIFVRAFADSDGDGVGDFNGITEKLDYLKDLGIDGLWLMPIYPSDSYHGYAVTDYDTVNPDYGTEEDFKKLVEAAHDRGMKVILDFVANHTSSEHTWFKSAREDADSSYRDYYRFVSPDDVKDYQAGARSPWGTEVWHPVGKDFYYGIFSDTMPDLNYNNPDVRAEMENAAKKWLQMGVDGFRLDGAIHIYGVHEFEQQSDRLTANIQWWNEFARSCEEVNPNVYLVGETWQNRDIFPEYAQPLDSKFDFPMADSIISAVVTGTAYSTDKMPLAQKEEEIISQNEAASSQYIDAIFAGNHDKTRIMTAVGTVEKAKLTAGILMTLPGNPFIYYGDEIGMKGSKMDGDEYLREPFKWTEAKEKPYADWMTSYFGTTWDSSSDVPSLEEQQSDEDSLYHYYKKIISVRKSDKALSKGDFKSAGITAYNVFGFTRSYENEKLLVLHHLSDDVTAIKCDMAAGGKILFDSSQQAAVEGSEVTLPAYATVIIQCAQ